MNITHQQTNNINNINKPTPNSPDSPAPSISSTFQSSASPVHHHSNLALIQPSHSLASLSISSPTTTLQPNNSTTNPPSTPSPSILCSPISPLPQPTTGHLHNRSIPPPLSLASALSKSQPHHPSNPPSDDLMTARGSQFPIDTLDHRHHPNPSTTLANSCRFQPYLPPSLPNNDGSNWSSEPKPLSSNPPSALFLPSSTNFRNALDDASLSSNELRSSCSSLASTASSQSSGYFPPINNLPFEDPSSSATCGSAGEPLYPPLAAPGFSQPAAYPTYTGPSQRPSPAGLPYPTAAFTPSGGSPPIPCASSAYFHFDSAGAGRRHTVSAYASPMPIELNLVGHPEMDETLVKEEKRRRNKESSQRFRDRTRERQREKQERLEYLERRTKQLESQLRACNHSDWMQEGVPDPSGAQPTNRGRSEECDLIERLQAENKALRSSLKTATEEINRLQQLSGNLSPHSPLSISQVYSNTLAQLSPPASTDFAPGSQASSPAAEPSYFGQAGRSASPSSDSTPSNQQRLGQPNPPSVSSFPSNDPLPHLHQLSGSNPFSHQQISSPIEFWDNNIHSKVSGWQPLNDHQQSSQQPQQQ